MGTEKWSDEGCLVSVELLREAASKQMILRGLKFRNLVCLSGWGLL